MHIHFIGIGGIGMSGVARFLLKKGYHVSGSDKKETELTEKLREEGAKIYIGHKPHHVEGAKAVVFSSAIKSSNPEIKEAIRRGIYLIPRGRMVANITNDMENIVVAGTHGKTTTTALIAEFLLKKRIDPTIFIGGILKKINSNTKLGKDKIALVESDESDASFLFHHPDIAVITNIEDDHLDFYTSERNLIGAFSKFCNNTKPHGKIIINLDHPSSVYVLKKISPSRKVITYGFSPQASIKARKVILGTLSSSFQLIMGKKVLGEIKLPLAGIHNIYNFLAAFGVASTLGFDFPEVKKAVLSFEGVKRRMEKIGTLGQVPVFDDYAHHPTEIRAVLGELKKLGRRLIVIFQPHRFTRVKLLLPNFIEAFHNADILILTPIYPAGERPIPGVSGRLLFEALKKKRNLPTYYISSREKIVKFVMRNVQKEDIILTLGAGDITSLFRKRESLSR